MTNPTDLEALAVEQCDRDAAAGMLKAELAFGTQEIIRAGKLDKHPWVQAFARHRLTVLRTIAQDAKPMGYLVCHGSDCEFIKNRLTEADKQYGWTEQPLYTHPAPQADAVPMILHCPKCGLQHIDEATSEWPNPPHRSHLCLGCGCIWRPADVPTNGVANIETKGKADTHPAPQADAAEVTEGE